jgi:PTS system nitrogen regulatory IIA component
MYLNQVQLAEGFGVDEREIANWVASLGLPSIRDRGRLLFDTREVANWASSHGLTARSGFLARPDEHSARPPRLETLLRAGGIWRDVQPADTISILERVLAKLPGATPDVSHWLIQRLRAPNGVTWAPIGRGLALPHLRSSAALGPSSGILALVQLREGYPVSEPLLDDQPVTALFFFIAPTPRSHLELLARLSAVVGQTEFRRLIFGGGCDAEIFATLAVADALAASGKTALRSEG